MSIPSDWYVHVDGGSPAGPMPEGQLRYAIHAGRVPKTARVCRAGTSEWLPVGRSIFAREFGALDSTVLAQEGALAQAPERPRYDAAATFTTLTDVAAAFLVAFWFVPRGIEAGVVFAWDDLGKAPLVVFYPPALGLVVFVLNRFRLPAIVKGLAWVVGGLSPIVFFSLAMDRVAAHVLAVGGLLALSSLLFLRYLRFHSVLFRLLPLAGSAMLAIAYVLPVADLGGTTLAFEIRALEHNPAVGILGLGPLALAALGIVVSLVPPRGAPAASRIMALLTLLYVPLILAAVSLITAVDAGSGLRVLVGDSWLVGLWTAATVFGVHAIASAGLAGLLEQLLGQKPPMAPPPPVVAR